MAQLKDKIVADMTSAMKERNTIARDILRVIKGEIERNEQGKDGKIDLSDAQVLAIIKKSIDGIKETTNDETQIAVLETYLPKKMDESEIRSNARILIDEIPGSKNLGLIKKKFDDRFPGQDGRTLAQIIKEELEK